MYKRSSLSGLDWFNLVAYLAALRPVSPHSWLPSRPILFDILVPFFPGTSFSSYWWDFCLKSIDLTSPWLAAAKSSPTSPDVLGELACHPPPQLWWSPSASSFTSDPVFHLLLPQNGFVPLAKWFCLSSSRYSRGLQPHVPQMDSRDRTGLYLMMLLAPSSSRAFHRRSHDCTSPMNWLFRVRRTVRWRAFHSSIEFSQPTPGEHR